MSSKQLRKENEKTVVSVVIGCGRCGQAIGVQNPTRITRQGLLSQKILQCGCGAEYSVRIVRRT